MDFSGVMAIVFEIPLFFGPPCMYLSIYLLGVVAPLPGHVLWVVVLQLAGGGALAVAHEVLGHEDVEALRLARQPHLLLERVAGADPSDAPVVTLGLHRAMEVLSRNVFTTNWIRTFTKFEVSQSLKSPY